MIDTSENTSHTNTPSSTSEPTTESANATPVNSAGFALRWSGDATLCLCSQSTTPHSGDALTLASCSNQTNQKFFWDQGQFKVGDGTVCMTYGLDGNNNNVASFTACLAGWQAQRWFYRLGNIAPEQSDSNLIGFVRTASGAHLMNIKYDANVPSEADPNFVFTIDPSVFGSTGFTMASSSNGQAQCLGLQNGNVALQTCQQGQSSQLWSFSLGHLLAQGLALNANAVTKVIDMQAPSSNNAATLPVWYFGSGGDCSVISTSGSRTGALSHETGPLVSSIIATYKWTLAGPP